MYKEDKNETLAKMVRHVTYQIKSNTVISENILNGNENTLKIVQISCCLNVFFSSVNKAKVKIYIKYTFVRN